MHPFLQQLSASLDAHQWLPPGSQVLVAVSGGADSVALSLGMVSLGYKVTMAHCHFGLRAEANRELEWVKGLAGKLGCPLHVKKFDTQAEAESRQESIQEAARRLRYNWLLSVLEETGIERCATGHHRGDEAETILMNLMRSKGVRALAGVSPQYLWFIRPMLSISKETILDYLQSLEQEWCEDASNADEKYDRNYIRHSVIPVMQKLNPSLEAQLAGRLAQYNDQLSLLSHLIGKDSSDLLEFADDKRTPVKWWIDKSEARFGKQHLPLIADHLFAEILPGPVLRGLKGLIHARQGSKLHSTAGLMIRERDHISILNGQPSRLEEMTIESMPTQAESWPFHDQLITLQPAELRTEAVAGVYFLNAEAIQWPLHLRGWKDGDRMVPLGMTGSRKLSDIFIDQKFTYQDKRRAVIFEDRNQILCLSGFRIAEAAKVQPGCKSILKVTVS